MREKKRARRIRATDRKLKRTARKFKDSNWDLSEADLTIMSRKFRDNITICSCAMCGNPRRSHYTKSKECRLTRQELRNLDKAECVIEDDDNFIPFFQEDEDD